MKTFDYATMFGFIKNQHGTVAISNRIFEMRLYNFYLSTTEMQNCGEEQLAQYLDDYHQKKGYLISFNFNRNKEIGVKTITIGDKTIVEAVV